jgi:hypothetical protein
VAWLHRPHRTAAPHRTRSPTAASSPSAAAAALRACRSLNGGRHPALRHNGLKSPLCCYAPCRRYAASLHLRRRPLLLRCARAAA